MALINHKFFTHSPAGGRFPVLAIVSEASPNTHVCISDRNDFSSCEKYVCVEGLTLCAVCFKF
jgi:hypothetical protein